ncbi:DUF6396 domain-containing protein, partial [Pseudomonas syringae]
RRGRLLKELSVPRVGTVGYFCSASLGAKVPDLDIIAPLPPTKLPAWDGTFQWQKERDAKTAPDKPDDTLLQRLSKEKDLDPATGLPLTKN